MATADHTPDGRTRPDDADRGDGRDPHEVGRWIDRGDTVIYDSEWVRLVTTDVELPDGTRIDHHVVRLPNPAAGTIMIADERVLLLWRHRFITDTWGWEIPAGGIDEGESPEAAARREAREESGWQPRTLHELCAFHPANGVLDQTFHIFVSHDAEHVGDPSDTNEAARIEWLPIDRVRELLLEGRITDGLSFGALSYAFAAHAL
jgi:8-oxo-dGTP pyrophosphatase MutT (NUDIX family)